MSEEEITIPKPVVPYGPANLTEDEATALYFRELVRKIRRGAVVVGGHNVSTTIITTLTNIACALDPVTEVIL